MVTYTCTVIQGTIIGWTADPVLVDSTLLRFQDTSPSGESRSCSDTPSMQCADLDYLATLTNVTTVEPPITDPPTSGQPLYNGHWPWHQLKLLQN